MCDETVLLYPIDTSESATSALNSNPETQGPEPKKKRTLRILFKPKDQKNPSSPVSLEEKVQCEVATYLKCPSWTLSQIHYSGGN